jgi:shikimate kinase/3-dehydroquinate synthase
VETSEVDAAIVLVGFMGAGKSTGARTLAAELGVDAVDSDREVERRLGEPIENFFDREGEGAFRAVEEEVVGDLLERQDVSVIALGGGAVQSERVREALTRHTVVHLEIETADAWRRASNKGRPLARDPDRFEQLHRDRATLYEAVADAVIPPADRDALRRALPFLRALGQAPAGTRLVWAAAESGAYPVYFGRGLIGSGFFPPLSGRRFVVTDENVVRVHPLEGDERIVVMPGEERKTIHSAEMVLRSLAQARAERGDLVVAAGGGVVGDLAGFCAAVYQRGMRHVQVPTTLVAQVDSAYGGKTGVDLPEGKNYVGAFHQPSAVLCDPAVLDTLPAEETAAGYVEVLKTALIAGGALWARVRQGGPVSAREIMGCARTKLAVVAEDERDAGRRQVLNLGHTVGHAIEAATGFSRYRHGEAVGIGLLVALRLSDRDALRSEVADLLADRGLPLTYSGAAPDVVAAVAERDKKRVRGRVPFVLVEAPGQVTPGHDVDFASLYGAIDEVHDP